MIILICPLEILVFAISAAFGLLIKSMQFLAFGMISVLPIIKYWLKDTNMIEISEEIVATEAYEEFKVQT